MTENKKYSEMTYEEFITDVLEIELNKEQRHLARLFDENKTKKVEYINTYPSYPTWKDTFPNNPLTKPLITYTSNDDSACCRPKSPIDDLE